jgi:hypothetical protein
MNPSPVGALVALLLGAPAGLTGQDTAARYIAVRVPGPIVVNGRLDEQAWASAAWSTAFTDIEGDIRPAPRWRTRMKLGWDSTALYVAAELE